MKRYLSLGAVTIALLMTSCGISKEAASNLNVSQTEVILAKKNYKVVGTAQGESTQNYWFGIGGMSSKSMKESAIAEMYRNANLSGSRAVINVNVSYKNKMMLIHYKKKAIATGTIIEFTE